MKGYNNSRLYVFLIRITVIAISKLNSIIVLIIILVIQIGFTKQLFFSLFSFRILQSEFLAVFCSVTGIPLLWGIWPIIIKNQNFFIWLSLLAFLKLLGLRHQVCGMKNNKFFIQNRKLIKILELVLVLLLSQIIMSFLYRVGILMIKEISTNSYLGTRSFQEVIAERNEKIPDLMLLLFFVNVSLVLLPVLQAIIEYVFVLAMDDFGKQAFFICIIMIFMMMYRSIFVLIEYAIFEFLILGNQVLMFVNFFGCLVKLVKEADKFIDFSLYTYFYTYGFRRSHYRKFKELIFSMILVNLIYKIYPNFSWICYQGVIHFSIYLKNLVIHFSIYLKKFLK